MMILTAEPFINGAAICAVGKILESTLITAPERDVAGLSRPRIAAKKGSEDQTFPQDVLVQIKRNFKELKREFLKRTKNTLKMKVMLLPDGVENASEFNEVAIGNPFERIHHPQRAVEAVKDLYTQTGDRREPTTTGEAPDVVHRMDGLSSITLTEEQRVGFQAIRTSSNTVTSLQANPGSGKTFLVAAALAAEANAPEAEQSVVHATTNAAVDCMTAAISQLQMAQKIPVVRFVAETAKKQVSSHPYDLDKVLKEITELPEVKADADQSHILEKFLWGRNILDNYDTHPKAADLSSEKDREDYIMAEQHASELLTKAVDIMFLRRPPMILIATTASLIRLLGKDGLFHNRMDIRLCCWDEASQAAVIIFLLVAAVLPNARHVYVGDFHQLPPYTTMAKDSFAVR